MLSRQLRYVPARSAAYNKLTTSSQAEYLDKTAELVTFLRLHGLLSNRHPDALALNLNEAESIAVYSITETLFHEVIAGKTDIIRSIYTGEGEHLGVPCTPCLNPPCCPCTDRARSLPDCRDQGAIPQSSAGAAQRG